MSDYIIPTLQSIPLLLIIFATVYIAIAEFKKYRKGVSNNDFM